MMKQYIRKENVEATELDGEWVIFNTEQYTITKVNDVGGHCWSLLNQPQTADTLTQSLVEKFSSPESKGMIEKDIEEFLDNLINCGLIHYVD
jgi:hypothetical protein